MGRALIVLTDNAARAKAAAWISKAPAGTRVEFKASKRSLPQNDKLWAMLTDIAQQAEWAGKRRTTEEWKDLFTAAVKTAGGGVEAVPGLTGGIMLLGLRTSDMSVGEMADLLTFIDAWGAEHGVVFSEAAREGEVANNASPVAA
jgi:hypothetical protein